MHSTREERLAHFNLHIRNEVEGWLGDRMSQVIDILGGILDAGGVRGDIVEFGVHHGLFLFLLNALRADNERCVAIDVFDQQHLNIDGSGAGSLTAFLSHVDTLWQEERDSFIVIQRDTSTFSTKEIADLLGQSGVKFLSIDAGHTSLHAYNDLCLAQEVLTPGGIIALDDYLSVHWPGVTEGFYRFMQSSNRRLKPFLNFQNKLFLTTISEHARCLAQFRAVVETRFDYEVRMARWKDVEIAGTNCLSFS